jgi:hypothetical protein
MMRTRRRGALRAAFRLTGAAALASLLSCAGTAPGTATRRAARAVTRAPEPDSITAGVWHFDETGGTRAADAGPFRLDGTVGVDTRTDFGRMRSARRFVRSVESFMFVPYSPALEQGSGLTVEAWVYVDAYGRYEDTPIAGRWTPLANEQSWLFSIVGERLEPPYVSLASPGYHRDLVQSAQRGQLLFAFQPEPASLPFVYTTASPIEIGRWTHVGVTYDGSVVRFFIDGRRESQYASVGAIRRTRAPLVVGNSLDPRAFSDFAGDLRVDALADRNPYYAFEGLIDELRVSTAARAVVTAGR